MLYYNSTYFHHATRKEMLPTLFLAYLDASLGLFIKNNVVKRICLFHLREQLLKSMICIYHLYLHVAYNSNYKSCKIWAIILFFCV